MELIYQRNVPVDIEDEMKKSYMDYAMSVIVGRAIPDVRDGLKPVHRRVLYAMHELGNRWNRPYKKSARIVGDIIGKYHPHGDSAAYDTIVRMAQDFSMRYPLVDGQGNFGSIDGDPPAAMRYTEIRMARIAEELLEDLDKETVGFSPNYDNSLVEPAILPARIPLLLLNGGSGIAVGVASNIPPHNLGEVLDGTMALIRNPAITVEELMMHIHGPDFPTAGYINGREGILSAYRTGRGIIRMRARSLIERNPRNDRESIIVTELPYMVNKATLVERISELVKEKKISGISDLRDESDREGMRVVLDLKKDEVAGVILNQLFKHTQMESTFGINMMVIDRGQPKTLNLKEVLEKFVDFRKETVTRRTVYELNRAKERLHVLEGLKIALENIDRVIETIKKSPNPQAASAALCDRFGLSAIQARAILEMRLQRLTNLERDKILEEHGETERLVRHLEAILADPSKILDIIQGELEDIKKRYGDGRRTEIVSGSDDITVEDLIVEEDMVVTVSHQGYIKRNAVSLYRSQRRGGRGKMGMTTKEDDFVENIFVASTHSYVLFFTSKGKVHWLKVHQIPQAGRMAKGKAIVNLIELAREERVTAILPVREFTEGKYVLFATRKGIVKKTELAAYSNPRSAGIIAITIDEDDELIAVKLTDGTQDVLLGTNRGKAIRFRETEVRPIGRTGRGVIGINMEEGDFVVSMETVGDMHYILTVTERGFGKKTDVSEYRRQGRGGRGIINLKTVPRVGLISGVRQVTGEEDVILLTNNGQIIRLRVNEISILHRSTQGIKLMDLIENENIVGVVRVEREPDEDREETEITPEEEVTEEAPEE